MSIVRVKSLFLLGLPLVFLCALAYFHPWQQSITEAVEAASYSDSELFLPDALRRSESFDDRTLPRSPLAAIGPHHLPFSGMMLTDLYAALSKARPVTRRIVLLAPDHAQVHAETTTTACLEFETSVGTTECSKELIDQLHAAGLSVEDAGAITDEHGLFTHLAYIQSYFPNATLIPVMFGERVNRAQTRDFAEWLDETLIPADLLIVSTDLSHYQPVAIAKQEDAVTLPILLSVNQADLLQANLDTRPAVQTLFEFLRLRGIGQGTLVDQANSADFGANPNNTTSYATVVY